MRTDVIDQVLAMALHPAYDFETAEYSVYVITNLIQSPEAHTYIVRKKFVENILEILYKQKQKVISEQSLQSHQYKKEDPMMINVLKYVIVPPPFSVPSTYSLII